MNSFPLDDIKVISLEQAVAAPFASRQLAELGARVIKVERPKVGDFARNYDDTVQGLSANFVWLNHSKESLTLDIKSDDGKKILHKLLETADVLIQNLIPGAIERLGFSDEFLKKNYPQLIICHISGYGRNGSFANKKAYDLLIQCEAGLTSITGSPETPSKCGVSIADIAAGMYAYTGILTSIINRYKTNKGGVIEISMLESLAEWMKFPALYVNHSEKKLGRIGSSHFSIYPYGPFKCGDDKVVMIGIQNEREWAQFCTNILRDISLIENDKFKTNSLRSKNRKILEEIIIKKLSDQKRDDVISELDNANIANARVNDLYEFWDHYQLKERNRWTDVSSENGLLKTLIPPVTADSFNTKISKIPSLGEHSQKILNEIHYDKQQIFEFSKKGVI